jgi:large subunit ribosomal protein L1
LASFVGTVILFAAFVKRELSTNEPLLDVRVFRNARLSVATGSIGIAFFVLFGFTFLVTQYFQFVRGYSTLSAGVHTLPFAIGAGITAPIAARLALKFGTKRIVALGLTNMCIGLVIIGFCGAETAYWGPVIISMVFLANGLALVTSPSTDAIMGELPREKAGVGSAVNDVSREVGGTLGVAISGSIFASLYGPKLGELVAKFNLPAEAVALARETGSAKFDSTVEVALKLGVDPRKADQMIRGTVSLPHGTGKVARVIVFANGAAADAAREAGADEVGGDELIAKVEAGWVDFDYAVATPDLMGKVGRLGKVLGPRNLMPNPKTGTVTMDTAKAVTDIKGGKIDFRIDKQSNLHFIIGKASFTQAQLAENLNAAMDEVVRLKPSTSKGKYLLKGAVATTFGPGIPLDTATFM